MPEERNREHTRKEWHPPRLQKLPIAATANSPGKGLHGDEGGCGGKGDAGLCVS
jgi:hypothetical protein